jgi:diguanylate cyclase (GGDEF)-like protein
MSKKAELFTGPLEKTWYDQASTLIETETSPYAHELVARALYGQHKAEYEGRFDGLTGSLNRKAFMTSLGNLLSNLGDDMDGILVMSDMVGLKKKNKKGHHIGDAAIKRDAQFHQGVVEEVGNGFAGRLGGDEMALVLLSDEYVDIELAALADTMMMDRPLYMEDVSLRWCTTILDPSKSVIDHFRSADPKNPDNKDKVLTHPRQSLFRRAGRYLVNKSQV